MFFNSSYTVPSTIERQKHASRQTANLPNQSLFVPAVYPRRKLAFTSIYLVTTNRSIQAILGHSAAPHPYNYVAALVLYETRGSLEALNRWEYEWLALSPKFIIEQHLARENSYSCVSAFFKLTKRWRSKLYSVRFCGVFRIEESVEVIWQSYKKKKKIAVNVKLSFYFLKIDWNRTSGSGVMPFSVWRVSYR